MPTADIDKQFLLACAGAVVVGVALLGVGYWLMPLRTAKHWWHNR